ncbi:MAG: type IIL restriction-modification enzyme MmeI, partial [Verrucomicrobiota bacterium]
IDSADGAAVRIAMTVAAPGRSSGILEKVTSEQARDDGENEVTLSRGGGVLAANLQIGADLSSVCGLRANDEMSNRGFCLFGAGFIVTTEDATHLLSASDASAERVIWKYRNGKDLTNRPRDVMLIDAYPFGVNELQTMHPAVYQHLLVHVKPERDHNARACRRNLWWAFGEPNKKLREQLAGLPRYIATVETSKHRFFTFLDREILPDNMLIAIASDDAFILGVLSSQVHVTWALAAGGRLGMGNDPRYNKSRCFEPFPFPALEEGPLKQRIRDLGERLDAHRKRQQELYPDLTLTGIYNVLEKLRSGAALDAKDKAVHDRGLVSVLKQLHDDLDAAVLEAYGWQDLKWGVGGPPAFSSQHGQAARAPLDAEGLEQLILSRLVALNHEHAAEEKRGLIRWLRPDYQSPSTATSDGHRPPLQSEIEGIDTSDHSTSKIQNSKFPDWPAELPAQVAALRKLLPTIGQAPGTVTEETSASSVEPLAERLSACFGRKSRKRVDQITAILDTLKSLGLVN